MMGLVSALRCWGEGHLGALLRLLPRDLALDKRMKMNGWMDME